jgi:hypothetical protein
MDWLKKEYRGRDLAGIIIVGLFLLCSGLVLLRNPGTRPDASLVMFVGYCFMVIATALIVFGVIKPFVKIEKLPSIPVFRGDT